VRLTLVDSSLRDGMHTVSHRFEPDEIRAVARSLDLAGADVIEVGHGDGLGGSSIQYGESAAADRDLISAAVGAVKRARVAVLLLPGVGTLRHLEEAHELGASVARIATHCTEPDIARQHIRFACAHGMTAVGFLMMSHMLAPSELAEQAALMASYGAHVVYVVDSAGALVPASARERILALRNRLDCEVGFHGHDNLGCAIGNTLAAVDAGATWVDGSMRGLGAGAGNARLEVLAAALERSGRPTTASVSALIDTAEDIVRPLMEREQVIDRNALMLGYAGVYSSFLLHAERAAERYGIPAHEILVELGRRKVVGGQEDMVIDVAARLSRRRSEAA
jgi:4-hydroxy 2-oxovalerate aldolase